MGVMPVLHHVVEVDLAGTACPIIKIVWIKNTNMPNDWRIGIPVW
jgi:hypothetical protein